MLAELHLVYLYPGNATPRQAIAYAIDSFQGKFGDEPNALLVNPAFPQPEAWDEKRPPKLVRTPEVLRLGQIWMPLGAHAEEYSR